MILTWQIPGDKEGLIQQRLECMTHHHMMWWWGDMVGWWHDQLVMMELVLSWYKMRHRVGLVVQSLLYSTTKQPPNNCSLLNSNMLMINSCTFHSSNGLNTITRPPPKRSGGDYLSGQQVVITNLSSFWLKTNLLWFRSMIWSSQTFPWPRSSGLLEWTTTCGFRPSSTMKSWSDSGDSNQTILIKGSCGGLSGWG